MWLSGSKRAQKSKRRHRMARLENSTINSQLLYNVFGLKITFFLPYACEGTKLSFSMSDLDTKTVHLTLEILHGNIQDFGWVFMVNNYSATIYICTLPLGKTSTCLGLCLWGFILCLHAQHAVSQVSYTKPGRIQN